MDEGFGGDVGIVGMVGMVGWKWGEKRLRGGNNGYGLQGGIVDVDSSVKLPIWRENLTICLLYLY